MKLRPYQEAAVDYICEHPKCALFADVGVGKTAMVLHALKRMYDNFDINRVLIVGPGRVIRDVWPQEIEDWGLNLSYWHCTDSPKMRAGRLQLGRLPFITFITPDLIPWLKTHYGKTPPPWDTVIIDESSNFAESNTKRWRSMKPFALFANRVVELTGTPASNGLHKLWAQMFLLDQGKALGFTKADFLSNYFILNEYSRKYEIKRGMDNVIHKRVARMVMRIDGNDHLQLPECLTNAIRVRLPDEVMTSYRRLESEFLMKLENGGVLAANNASSLSNKCRQIANGNVYDENGNWHAIHNGKLEALRDLLDALDEQPLLLYYQYVSDRARIEQAFPEAVHFDEKGAFDRWRKGEIKLLIAHPASGGHGINIHQGGAKHTAYYGLPWSLELYDQSKGRLNGARARETSFVHHIIAVGTIEERMSAVLIEKARTQTDLLNAVKRAA